MRRSNGRQYERVIERPIDVAKSQCVSHRWWSFSNPMFSQTHKTRLKTENQEARKIRGCILEIGGLSKTAGCDRYLHEVEVFHMLTRNSLWD